MKSLSSKEKWFQAFAREARFTLSPAAFRKSADKTQRILLAAERQNIPEKTICGRLEEPEKLVARLDREERQRWRKPVAVLAAVFLVAYVLWWCVGWHYIMYAVKGLTILIGTFLIPRICGFLSGKSYYMICVAVLQRKEQNKHTYSAISTVALLIFLTLDGYIFPYAVLRIIFGDVLHVVFFIAFHVLFFGWIVFLSVYGICKIQRFDGQGCQILYLGNGLLHSFLMLYMSTQGMMEPDLEMTFWGMALSVLPFAADLFLYQLERKADKRKLG